MKAVLDIFASSKKKGIDTVVHAWGGPVAIMANYHCAFACNGSLVEYPMIPFEPEKDMFSDQRTIKNGRLLKPSGFGIGITMDERVEKKFKFDPTAVYSCLLAERGQPQDDYWK
jgi:L-alanine-DL-glutamate epimerase-like enolase superfamily enzyme